MKPLLMLRALVYLKRISRDLGSIAASQKRMVELSEPQMPRAKHTRVAEVFTPSIEQMNEAYQRNQQGYEDTD